MKVLGISGSLRDQSNTWHYVNTALKVLEEQGIDTELISLRNKEIKPCTGCYDCQTQGFCTITGDDFEEIFTRMRAAEGLILGSPVYLSSVVPQMMALLARATFVSYCAAHNRSAQSTNEQILPFHCLPSSLCFLAIARCKLRCLPVPKPGKERLSRFLPKSSTDSLQNATKTAPAPSHGAIL